MIPGIQVSVYAIPVWVAFMGLCYWIKNKRRADQRPATVVPAVE